MKKPVKPVVFDIPLTPYRFVLHVIVTEDREAAKRYVERVCQCKTYGFPDYADGFCNIGDGLNPILWIPRVGHKADDWEIITHEASHVVRSVLIDNCGMPHSKDSDEAFAYLHGYIVREIMDRYAKKKGKK